jgi:hypothetical protein
MISVSRVLTIAFLVFVFASTCNARALAQAVSEAEILQALLPNGIWAEERNLEKFNRSDEIRALTKAQVNAKEWRAVSIAYLLAILKHKYWANRQVVVNKHNSCRKKPYPGTYECWDLVSEPLMGLFRRGDHPLLLPLLAMGPYGDGAFSESMGSFYADTLRAQPRLFLKTLATFPWEIQHTDAMLAGYVDGSGMEAAMLSEVRGSLQRISSKPLDPLVRVARLVLTEVNKANRKQT